MSGLAAVHREFRPVPKLPDDFIELLYELLTDLDRTVPNVDSACISGRTE
jgi:hypothetical protein